MVMLKGIPELLSPELLFALAKMGHGDEIVLADANFPTSSICRCGPVEVRADGLGIPQLLESILKLLPLDTYEPNSVVIMDLVESDKARGLQIPVWETYKSLLLQAGLKVTAGRAGLSFLCDGNIITWHWISPLTIFAISSLELQGTASEILPYYGSPVVNSVLSDAMERILAWVSDLFWQPGETDESFLTLIIGGNAKFQLKVDLENMERFAFYERAKKAFAVVATGETSLYGNIILRKGVIASQEQHMDLNFSETK